MSIPPRKLIDVWIDKWAGTKSIETDIWKEPKLMPDLMEHEIYRWNYMTYEKMLNRISKIRSRDKLDCFLKVAKNKSGLDGYLFLAGLDRWFQLFGEPHDYERLARRPSGPITMAAGRIREERRATTKRIQAREQEKIVHETKQEKPFEPPIRVIR